MSSQAIKLEELIVEINMLVRGFGKDIERFCEYDFIEEPDDDIFQHMNDLRLFHIKLISFLVDLLNEDFSRDEIIKSLNQRHLINSLKDSNAKFSPLALFLKALSNKTIR